MTCRFLKYKNTCREEIAECYNTLTSNCFDKMKQFANINNTVLTDYNI